MHEEVQVGKILGSGDYRYEVISDWAKLPEGWHHHDVSAIAVDGEDNVYIFARSEHPLTVFDREGNFLWSMGEGIFKRPHGVFLAPDGTIFLTDDGDHTVRQFDRSGRLLLTLGEPDKPAPSMSGQPFNRCTNVAMSPEGDIYVSDGYRNARVHKFAPDGRHLLSWGEPGIDAGQFNVVHHIACDSAGVVYVADRENHRVQIFDGEGNYQEAWHDFHRPNGFYLRKLNGQKYIFMGEAAPAMNATANWWGIGPWISIFDDKGKCLAKLGAGRPGYHAGAFISPHGLAVDSRGDIYVGECSKGGFKKYFKEEQPARLKCLQKLVRVP